MRIRMSIIGKLTLAAIFLIFLFLVGSANAGCVGVETGTDFGCGDTVTENCMFDENMSCSSGHGLVIGENVTLNGNGYMLDGTSAGACDGLGIQRTGIYNKAHDDVVIKDLEVKNFCNGIYFKYDSEEGDRVEGVIIENCSIHHNGGDTGGDNSVHGIKAIGVFDSVIKNCKIHHNVGKGDSCEGGGNGIFLKGISGFGAWNNTIIHNEIYDNRKGGFFTKMICKDTEVSYNNVWKNGQGGIILRCKKTTTHDIHHNNASCNYGDGIFVGGPDNIIRDNIVNNNKAGFKISPTDIVGDGDGIDMGRSDGSYNNELYNNTVCGNEGTDIDTYGAGSGTTGDNNTCDTCSNYNDEGEICCTYNCPGEYPAGCVAADGTVFRCGDTVTKSCTLNGSMSCEGDGLIIGSGQIRIYGDGYCVEGNGTGTGIYSAGNTFLEIHDLAIKNFEKGIWLQHVGGTPTKIYDYEIDNCNINNNTVGIDVDDLDTRSCTIEECEVHHNDKGIYVHGENGKNVKITDNKIYDNAISGIYSEDVCSCCEVDSNLVSQNGEGITVNASQWTVKSNVVTNNSGSGIYVSKSSNTLFYNTIGKNKGDGIHIADEGTENITLESNTVCYNQPKDIFAVSELSASGDNNSCENCVNYNDSGAPSGKCCTYSCVGCVGELTGTLYRCGGIVTESCTFNGDMTCTKGDGLIVGASGTAEAPIVIDGAEHAIDGIVPGTSPRTGIYNPDASDYITIKDLEIQHFHHGINLGGSPGHSGTVEYNVIDNCSVHDNGDPEGFATHGIATYHARKCIISNCTVYNNTGSGCGSCEDGGRGILLYGPGDHNTITHNRVYDNGMVGIYSKMQNKYNYVAYNDVFGNGKQLPPEGTFMPGGISLACIKTDYWVVEYNNIADNCGSGISVGGSNNIFRYNDITNTSIATGGQGNGIYIGRCSSNHTLISNVFCKNEGEDIYVQDCCYNVTGDENTCDTADNYCDASADCPPPCVWYCSHRADFSAEPTKGAEPLVVHFTDKSTYQGDITTWFWDFGDGETSTDQNPIHTYNAICPYSYYNVSLAVEWWGGEDKDTKTETDYIVVWEPSAAPNADFSASPRKMAISPMTVEFTDQSTGDVESWFWEFGAGETSEGQNPTHEYTTGVYNVTLTVTGPGGSARDTKTNYIVVNQPDPVPAQTDASYFASSRSGSPPLEVTFTDMSRSASDINSWKWNFGDGSTSDKQNPTHTYSTEGEGTYNVSLEVTAGGAKAKETKTGYITVTPETIFDTGAPANPYPSIFGTHNGTIIPDQDIIVNKMYTYPCEGTGGHAGYAMIWNETTGDCAEARWNGYTGDYHNISFNRTLTLRKGVIYSYVIRTGSYPQIIHAREYEAKEGGDITCTEFRDANGKVYEDWIPAIRLWWE